MNLKRAALFAVGGGAVFYAMRRGRTVEDMLAEAAAQREADRIAAVRASASVSVIQQPGVQPSSDGVLPSIILTNMRYEDVRITGNNLPHSATVRVQQWSARPRVVAAGTAAARGEGGWEPYVSTPGRSVEVSLATVPRGLQAGRVLRFAVYALSARVDAYDERIRFTLHYGTANATTHHTQLELVLRHMGCVAGQCIEARDAQRAAGLVPEGERPPTINVRAPAVRTYGELATVAPQQFGEIYPVSETRIRQLDSRTVAAGLRRIGVSAPSVRIDRNRL